MSAHAGVLLAEVVPSIRQTAGLVQEIAGASQEQSSGIEQVNVAMSQIGQTIQTAATSSEELASTAEEMSAAAMQLQEAIVWFKTCDIQNPVLPQSAPKPDGVRFALDQNTLPYVVPLSSVKDEPIDESQFSRF